MVKMKTLTVSGQTYTVSDPEAVHSINGRVPDEAGNIRVIDDGVTGDFAWSGKQTADRLCSTFIIRIRKTTVISLLKKVTFLFFPLRLNNLVCIPILRLCSVVSTSYPRRKT